MLERKGKLALINSAKAKGECMPVDIEIDSMTNCLIEKATGKELDTTFSEIRKTISKKDSNVLQEKGWEFDWSIPHKEGYQVFALYIQGSNEIQGLIALKHMREDFYSYVCLVESAPHNRSKSERKYVGVGAHLFAIACKLSFEAGNDGYVVFESKTNLVDHYQKVLGATLIGSQRMCIETDSALKLVKKYFKEELE